MQKSQMGSVSFLFDKLAGLIAEGWCQNSMALTVQNKPCLPTSNSAVIFDLWGAWCNVVHKYRPAPVLVLRAESLLKQALLTEVGGTHNSLQELAVAFNDGAVTGKDQVLALIGLAKRLDD